NDPPDTPATPFLTNAKNRVESYQAARKLTTPGYPPRRLWRSGATPGRSSTVGRPSRVTRPGPRRPLRWTGRQRNGVGRLATPREPGRPAGASAPASRRPTAGRPVDATRRRPAATVDRRHEDRLDGWPTGFALLRSSV